MADNYIFKLLGECDPIPDGVTILSTWDFLVFDPVLEATYKATGKQLVDELIPNTTFGELAPVYPSAYPLNSVYFETPVDGGLRIWQLTDVRWELKWDFAGGTVPVVTSYTATKGYTASCNTGYSGTPVFRQATKTSTISQEDADSLASAAAKAAATSALVCSLDDVVFTSTQSYTASCPSGSTGMPVTQQATVLSTISQEDADRKALASAKSIAMNALVCTVVPATPGLPAITGYNVPARTFTVAAPSGYVLADLDYVINDAAPLSVSNATISVGNAFVPIDGIMVYVRATSSRNQGLVRYSATAYPIKPSAPTIGTAVPGNNTIHVSWTAPASTEESPIDSYEIYLTNTQVLVGTTNSNTLSYDDNNAVNGTARSYQVLAVNVAGKGSKSAGSTPVTPVAPVTTPAAPGVLADDTANKLEFTSPLGTGEIIVSVNNGSYGPYTGPYSIGDFNVAYGTYQAKVKAAAGRTESAVSSSPAFTKAVVTAFDTTLPTPQGVIVTDGMSFSPGTTASAERLSFNKITNTSGATISIAITSAGSTCYVDYASEYAQGRYDFINVQGTVFKNKVFPSSDNLNITF